MTSRERILAALNHRETDRVPIDFGGHRSSGITGMAYARLREYLGLEQRPIRIYDPIQQLAIIDEDVLDRFGADTIELGRGFSLTDDCWSEWTLPNGIVCRMPAWALPGRQDDCWILRSNTSGRALAKMPTGVQYFEQCHWPYLDGADTFDNLSEALSESMWSGIASPPGPTEIGEPDGQDVLAAGARKLRESTDRAILGLFGGNLFEMGQFVFRMDNFLMLMAAEPKTVHAFLDKLIELHLHNVEQYLGAVGDCIDIICIGDDFGMQSGPLISTPMYREFFKPRQQMLIDKIREMADVKVNLHSCGDISSFLPDIIDVGIDAVNPVQISCAGMDLTHLKREYGKDLTFWGGGCDTHQVLPHGTTEEVAKHVNRQVAVGRQGGGFIFQQVHNIQTGLPPENVVAMFDAVNTVE
jgi:uroporphyrinogen decarboxylase